MLEQMTPLKAAFAYSLLHMDIHPSIQLALVAIPIALSTKLHLERTKCQLLSVLTLLVAGGCMGVPRSMLQLAMAMEARKPTFGTLYNRIAAEGHRPIHDGLWNDTRAQGAWTYLAPVEPI